MTRSGGAPRLRAAPLRAAAILATVFIGARVVYRLLFDGMDAGGPVLLALPSLRLAPPFAHVVLLGPVTAGGLWDAVASAVPIAAIILAFGVLNSLVDLSRAFSRLARRGPLRGVARVLAVAWATLPALADAVRSVRFAFRLRGERFGVRALVPVLERTLERASAVAAALELRGLGARGAAEPDCARPVVVRDAVFAHSQGASARGSDFTRHEVRGDVAERDERNVVAGFTGHNLRVQADERDERTGETTFIGHDPRGDAAERDRRTRAGVTVTDFTPQVGTLTVVTGATGSGKSTLLRGLAGLLSHTDGGALTGTVLVAGLDRAALPPRETARFVGVVLQNPRDAFATERVRDELGLALELRGVASVIVAARVAEVAGRVGISDLLDRPVRALSAGEATLVAIAAAVVEHPVVLLVDEPLADLDADARVRVVQVLDALAHQAGVCVIVAEHRAVAFDAVADAWWTISEGELAQAAAAEAAAGRDASAQTAGTARACDDTSDLPSAQDEARERLSARVPAAVRNAFGTQPDVLAAHAVSVERSGTAVVRDASLTLRAGEIAAIVGPNGAGKSSLLAALALPERGMAVTASGRVALVPDVADDLFTRDTVGAELRAADRRAGAARAAVRFADFLGPDAAAHLERQHPRDLSVGERRCLAIALQMAADPAVLLIDEPTRGLDASACDVVARALRAAADAGAAVLIATHDMDFGAALGARILPMRDGAVGPGAPASISPAGVQAPDARTRSQSVPSASAQRPREDAADAPVWETQTEIGYGMPTASSDGRGAASVERMPVASPPPARARAVRTPRRWPAIIALTAANLVALAAFCWPLVAIALPSEAAAAAPFAAMALAPLAAVVVAASLDGSVRSAHMIALLGVLAAVGAAVRIASTGVGGVEAVFILLILAGRAFGARFGLLLGVATIAISSVLWGGVGPWTPFQMFACAWVGAGAGLLPRRVRGWAEIGMLAAYGVLASYVFGLLMNLWFWPFAVGAGTGISYAPGAPLGQNLSSFLVYSLITSTLSWDTLRAITTVVGVVVIGRAVLAALRRAKPVAAGSSATAGRSGTPRTRPAAAASGRGRQHPPLPSSTRAP